MAITKRGFKFYSDLLPHAEFESVEEARHYDRNAALTLSAGRERAEKALEGMSNTGLADVVKAAMAVAADNVHAQEGQEIVEQFLELTPEFVRDGTMGAQNAGTISGYVKAKGILQPTVHDLRRAFEDLKSLGALHLQTVKHSR